MIPSNFESPPSGDDSLLRAVANLRERMRLQEDEIDNLRATVRYLRQQIDRGPSFGAPALDQSVLDRISRLEARSTEQSSTVQQFVAAMSRTDTNLQRLAVEIDRLLAQIVLRALPQIAAPPVGPNPVDLGVPAEPAGDAPPLAAVPFPSAPTPDFDVFDDEDDDAPRAGWKTSLAVITLLLCLLIGAGFVIRQARKSAAGDASASVFSPMERARVFENEKKFSDAESIYRDILKRDPQNADAARHLASVLFRENKIEESSVVLKQLVPRGSDQ